jgi:hypothetical protein
MVGPCCKPAGNQERLAGAKVKEHAMSQKSNRDRRDQHRSGHDQRGTIVLRQKCPDPP